MSAARAAPGAEGRGGLVLAGLIIAATLGLWFLLGGEERALRRSPTGFDGLAVWLRAEEIAARTQTGFSEIAAGQVGLRVLPLYDTRLDVERPAAETEEDLLMRLDEVDMTSRALAAKLDRLPTLLVLPKWRSGMRLTRIAHPVLIGAPDRLTGLLAWIGPGLGRVRVEPRGLTGYPVAPDARLPGGGEDGEGGEAQLYLPQVIAGADACRPIIGTRAAMVLGRCRTGDKRAGQPVRHFWLLSDPDLMNNHGLALGENAALAARLVRHMAGDGLTVIDYTTRVWATGPEPRRAREWSDLLRFFAWPFTILWLGLGLVAALVLWRSGLRDAPVIPGASGEPGAAKTVSIDAEARLMRLAGADGALLAAHVNQRLETLSTRLSGGRAAMSGRDGDALAPVIDWLGRRGIARRGALEDAARAARALPADAPAAEVADRLDRFEDALGKVTHELGHPSRHG